MALILKYKDAETSSNKKNQTQKSQEEAAAGSSSANGPCPFIDKITVNLTIKSLELGEEMHGPIYSAMTDGNEVFLHAGEPIKGFSRAALMVIPGGKTLARIDYRFSGKQANIVRLEFNPAYLGLDGLKDLHAHLSNIVPDGWRRFSADARISLQNRVQY